MSKLISCVVESSKIYERLPGTILCEEIKISIDEMKGEWSLKKALFECLLEEYKLMHDYEKSLSKR
jgi:hypothetical protein